MAPSKSTQEDLLYSLSRRIILDELPKFVLSYPRSSSSSLGSRSSESSTESSSGDSSAPGIGPLHSPFLTGSKSVLLVPLVCALLGFLLSSSLCLLVIDLCLYPLIGTFNVHPTNCRLPPCPVLPSAESLQSLRITTQYEHQSNHSTSRQGSQDSRCQRIQRPVCGY